MMKLYGYWRSSASYRVRIALALKGIEVKHIAVNLRDGAQLDAPHIARNPQGLVPVLELGDGTQLTQSLAIIDYLDAVYPEPILLPDDPVIRAKIRAAALAIAADIAPIQNLRVLKFIRAEHGQDDEGVKAWAAHWIKTGFKAVEKLAAQSDQPFLFSHAPGYFECCLMPQIYNAKRFGVDMSTFPNLVEIEQFASAHPAFIAAHPSAQSDAVV